MNRSRKIKLTALLLTILTLVSMLAACKSSDDPSLNSGSTTEAVTTEEPATEITLVDGGATEYVVIRPQKVSDAFIATMTKLRSAIVPLLTEGTIKFKDDFVRDDETIPENAKEIVLGVTNRPETEALSALVGEKDYAIYYKNDRVYIFAKNDKYIDIAVEHFIETYINTDNITVLSNTNDVVKYDYRFNTILIDGESIFSYRVVIPEKADQLTRYAAENMQQYLLAATGKTIDVVTDKEAETELEILIGRTNRQSSARAYNEAKNGKYVLYKNGKQIVTAGEGYLVGAGAASLITKFLGDGKDAVTEALPTSPTALTFEYNQTATSAILMIGDGMADNHIKATLQSGLAEFFAQQLPNKGYAITHSLNYPSVTDSAASATALSSGYKTYNKYLGLNSRKQVKQNVRELAQSLGARTAILTTDKITGATPSGFLVHIDDRNATSEIQKQIDAVIKAGEVDYCEGEVDDKFKDKIAEALYGMTDGDDIIFAMFEAALIDKRSHSNDLSGIYKMVTRYNDIIAYVIEYTLFHPDTALVITADHECGGVTLNNATKKYYFTSANHTNANVPVFAVGGGTGIFNGKTVDNTDIAKFLASVYAPDKPFGN